MKRSTARVLTTHTGSLPRPPQVVEALLAEQKSPGRQTAALVKEAMTAEKIRKGSAEKIAEILREAMIGFSHPKLVIQFLKENREPLLKHTLETVLNGLALSKTH